MNKNKLLLLSAAILMTSLAHAGVISATFTPQAGTVNVNLDTLQIGGNAVSDWMIFDDSSTANIHDRKSGGQLIVNPASASPTAPYTSYTFSWSGGIVAPGTGTSEAGLGYKINGAADFDIIAPAGSEGTYRLYAEAGATPQSFYNPFLGGIVVPAGTHGYIDVKFDNPSASPASVRLFSTWQNGDTGIYAAAASLVPEPGVIGLVALVGIGTLFIKRRFTA